MTVLVVDFASPQPSVVVSFTTYVPAAANVFDGDVEALIVRSGNSHR